MTRACLALSLGAFWVALFSVFDGSVLFVVVAFFLAVVAFGFSCFAVGHEVGRDGRWR